MKRTTPADPLAVDAPDAQARTVAAFLDTVEKLDLEIAPTGRRGESPDFEADGQVVDLYGLAVHLVNAWYARYPHSFPESLLLAMHRMGSGTHAGGAKWKVADGLRKLNRRRARAAKTA